FTATDTVASQIPPLPLHDALPISAEMAKLAETTYRDVNIALANQFARYAAANHIDVHQVIEAANSQPYSHIHRPGIAVGGHCIPDRKSTRLNSSHVSISYAVFCLK